MLLARLEADEPGLNQHFEMLRHGGLRQLHLAHDLFAIADGMPGQMPQDAHARRMRQRREHDCQMFVGLGGREFANQCSSFIDDKR